MLERLADYDDALMENLIPEIEPPKDRYLRGPRPRIARRPDLSGAARLRGARERRAAADEGAAP